jgi:hypothetical protein
MPTFNHPSADGPMKKWQVWDWELWDNNNPVENLWATFDTLAECVQIVKDEIEKTHRDVGEQTLPYDQFTRDGKGLNVIYTTPGEDTQLTKIKLADASNGTDPDSPRYGWIAYRTGFEPSD